VTVCQGDLEERDFLFLLRGRKHPLALDIETTGLDPKTDRVQVITLASRGHVYVVQVGPMIPLNVMETVISAKRLVIHHALFDLSFLFHWWGVRELEGEVFCTRVAAKLLHYPSASLKDVVPVVYPTVTLAKTETFSDWGAETLSVDQIGYCVDDVQYLQGISHVMGQGLEVMNETRRFRRIMEFLPIRVGLELDGFGDVIAYRPISQVKAA